MSKVVHQDSSFHQPPSSYEMERHTVETFPLVILANEPGTYRSLLATELPFLRPNLRVQEIDPADIEATVTTLRPAVVICSHAVDFELDFEVAFLVLRAGEIDLSIQSQDEFIVNPRLSDILGVIDRAVLAGNPGAAPSLQDN